MIEILPIAEADVDAVAHMHKVCFPRQQLSADWMRCNFQCYPRIQLYVAKSDQDKIVGYIQWIQKSGFRQQVVLELEQIAVLPEYQGQGIGHALITKSLPMVQTQLQSRGATLKHILVTTRADNQAQRLYKKALNAKIESMIGNLYSHDEVIMVARDIDVLMSPS